jgi:hypothetical protein
MISLLIVLASLPFTFAGQSNSKQGQVCGTRGYDAGTKAYYYEQKISLATVNACGAICAADSRCSSFAIGDNACLNYNVAV